MLREVAVDRRTRFCFPHKTWCRFTSRFPMHSTAPKLAPMYTLARAYGAHAASHEV